MVRYRTEKAARRRTLCLTRRPGRLIISQRGCGITSPSYAVAQKIKDVLEPETTDAEREELHQEDEDTTWFGISREDSVYTLFQDYGSYANLMVDSTHGSKNGGRDTRFPSLVSFVGETGRLQSTRPPTKLTKHHRCRKE